jgi:hypothetical protein
MPRVADDTIRTEVSKLLNAIGWNDPSHTNKETAQDFYVIVKKMLESVASAQTAGGIKGPGPIPHREFKQTDQGLVSVQESYMCAMTQLLLNKAYAPDID